MTDLWKSLTLEHTQAQDASKTDHIASLWSGYGEIFRVQLYPKSLGTLVVKQISPPETERHPRGWNTDRSQTRKLKSYEVETHWYSHWSHQCGKKSRVARHIASDQANGHSVILMEDLDASGYPIRHSRLSASQAKPCLQWLAQFHARFLQKKPDGLWPMGSYWHLDTRPDEFAAMQPSRVKSCAAQIDTLLATCKYQTIVHGDAKVANFCFAESSRDVAAVDFQYTGGGCGMKDVAYFFGSCFNEHECQQWVPSLLDHYFETLTTAVTNAEIDVNELEQEWRALFAPAWTDFHRFLLGWMPEHAKLHSYTESLAVETLRLIDKQAS